MVQWIPLGKWNFQPGFEPLMIQAFQGRVGIQDVAVVGLFALPVLVFWFARWKELTWLMWLGLLGYSGWLALEIQTWWIAYIFGASDTWMGVYQRVFSQSVQILPSFGRHLAPDGLHLVLQILLVVVVFSALLGLLDLWRDGTRAHSAKQ